MFVAKTITGSLLEIFYQTEFNFILAKPPYYIGSRITRNIMAKGSCVPVFTAIYTYLYNIIVLIFYIFLFHFGDENKIK